MKLKIGDKVSLNDDIGWNGESGMREECRPCLVYTVNEVCTALNGETYVQLEGVYSSYPVMWLIKKGEV